MKSIKNKKTGVITRVENTAAIQQVSAGTHEYVQKSEWKKATRG